MAGGFKSTVKISGESEYKRALADLNSSLKLLGSEMKAVSTQFDKNDTSVENLSNQNKVLNKQIEEQQKKVNLLKDALKKAKDETGEDSETTRKWQIQLNNAQADLNKLNNKLEQNKKDMSAAEKATDDETSSVKELGNEASKTETKFSGMGEGIKKGLAAAATAIAAIGTAAVAAGAGLWNLASDVAETGDEIDKGSQKVGLSAESYQKWNYAMNIAGTSMADCETGLKTLTNTIDDAKQGSDSAITKFDRLGISLDDLQGKSREEIFEMTIKALQEVTDDTEKAALANDMFGKSGQNLLPLLNQTSEETAAIIEQAEKYGMVMSDDAVKASAAFEDSLTKLQGTVSGLKNQLVGELLPGITLIADGLSDLIVGNEEAGEEIEEGVSSVISSVTDMVPQILRIVESIGSAVLQNLPSIFETLATSIVEILPSVLDTIFTDVLPQLVKSVISVIKSLIRTISDNLPMIVKSLSEGLVEIINAIFGPENIRDVINLVLGLIRSVIEAVQTALPVLIEGVFTLLGELISALPDFLEQVFEYVPAFIDQLSDLIVTNFPLIIDGIILLVEKISEVLPSILEKISSLIPQLIESAVQLLISALPVLIQGLIDLVLAVVRELPTILKSLISAIPNIVSSVTTALIENLPILIRGLIELTVEICRQLPTIIEELIVMLPDLVYEISQALIESAPLILDAIIQIHLMIFKLLGELLGPLLSKVGEFMGDIVSKIGEFFSGIWEAGRNLVIGLWNGIAENAHILWNNIQNWLSDIWDGILNFFGIHSPSTKMRDMVGKNLVKGIAEGIKDETYVAVAATEELAKQISDVNFANSIDFEDPAFNMPRYEADIRSNSPQPISISVQFGDVQINNDMDIYDVADRISQAIADSVVATGGAF